MATEINLLDSRRTSYDADAHDSHLFAMPPGNRPECGNPECSGSWLAFLKDRRRPIFDGRWGCSAGCIAAMVDTAIQREPAEGDGVASDLRHPHRMPLGLILLTQGWITQPQLQRALDAQRRAGTGLIGRWLIQESGVEQDHITRALSIQWGCPALSLEGFDPSAMALSVPKLLVEQLGIVPLRIASDRILYLAFNGKLDAAAAFAIERMNSLKVQSGLINELQWNAARQRICESSFVACAFEQVATREVLPKIVASTLNRMQPRASRLVRIHQFYWLRMWLETGAVRTRNGTVPATTEDVVDRIYVVGAEQ